MHSKTLKVYLYRKRELISQVATLLIGIGLFFSSNALFIVNSPPQLEEPITLSLIDVPEEPIPEVEKPAEIIPPEPQKKIDQIKTPEKPQIIQSTPTPSEPPKVLPAVNTLPSLDSPVTTQDNTELPSISKIVKPPVAINNVDEKQAPRSNGASESGFAQDVKARIERKKVYPDTARNLGMYGEVEVLYELDRSGGLIRAEVLTSSGHKLLDQAALRAVKSGVYGKFPDDAWIDSRFKEFRTKLVFQLN